MDSDNNLLQDGSWRNALVESSDIYFLSTFIAEFTLKLFGLGFFGYFLDRWNWLDSAVVSSG